MHKEIKVSVYISTYNRVDNLKRAIESVLSQTHKNLEIIVSDDCSSDGTQEFMMDLSRRIDNVIYIRNNENLGACATRNKAIEKATGEFLTGLDDDDEFTEDRIDYFLENWDDKYSFICTDFIERFPDGKDKVFYKRKKKSEYSYTHLLYDNNASNQIFTRTENLRVINGFDEKVRRLQDWDTWLRLSAKLGLYLCLTKPTYIMYQGHNNGNYRVSKTYPSYDSLQDLVERNNELYDKKSKTIIEHTIQYEKEECRLISSFQAAIYAKNFKYLGKYFYQKLGFKPRG